MLKLSLDEERLIAKALHEKLEKEEYYSIAGLYAKMKGHIDEVERMMKECELK